MAAKGKNFSITIIAFLTLISSILPICGHAADFVYSYDSLGRLVSTGIAGGQGVGYSYDSAGNRLTITSDTTPPTVPVVTDDGQLNKENQFRAGAFHLSHI